VFVTLSQLLEALAQMESPMSKSDSRDPLAGVSIMGLLASRMRMTEGQLYTAVLALLLALVLTLTGFAECT
jgi:hypothetical protein